MQLRLLTVFVKTFSVKKCNLAHLLHNDKVILL